jgi:hypothetical protein
MFGQGKEDGPDEELIVEFSTLAHFLALKLRKEAKRLFPFFSFFFFFFFFFFIET